MNYSENERLETLRAADNWRQWTSLDDERLCIECAQLITGREITLAGEENGKAAAYCPTPGCNGRPRDWFYHGARNHPPLANIVQPA
jgi:hypothetical protein